jgi:hypothetical protein
MFLMMVFVGTLEDGYEGIMFQPGIFTGFEQIFFGDGFG